MKASTERIRNMLCEELEELSAYELSLGSLDSIHKIVETIKNIDKIEMMGYHPETLLEHTEHTPLKLMRNNDHLTDEMRNMLNHSNLMDEDRTTLENAMRILTKK